MLKRLRRPLMALGVAGVIAGSALAGGIGSSGTAEAGCNYIAYRDVQIYTGIGDTVMVIETTCTGAWGSYTYYSTW